MDAAALAGLCALLARGEPGPALPPGVVCPPVVASTLSAPDRVDLRSLVLAPGARDAIARVTFAEAGDQGDSGLAAVVYTILNRLQDGRWGGSVDAVLNAPSQFEPVMRAGGDWRRLPPVSAAARARIDTILNLALDGRLPDLTHGARYFQNPAIVAARARTGQVAAGLVNFGGATPSAVIGAHSFYAEVGRPAGRSPAVPGAARPRGGRGDGVLIVSANAAPEPDDIAAPTPPTARRAGDPSQALFVGPDGQVSANQP